jgi:hypothetical protein
MHSTPTHPLTHAFNPHPPTHPPGIPIVFPQFGAGMAGNQWPDLPSHGFARRSRWVFAGLEEGEEGEHGALFTLSAGAPGIPDGLREASRTFPFELQYRVRLGGNGDALWCELAVLNRGVEEAFRAQGLLHTYYKLDAVGAVATAETSAGGAAAAGAAGAAAAAAADPSAVQPGVLHGLQGASYHPEGYQDRLQGEASIVEDVESTIMFTREVDRIYRYCSEGGCPPPEMTLEGVNGARAVEIECWAKLSPAAAEQQQQQQQQKKKEEGGSAAADTTTPARDGGDGDSGCGGGGGGGEEGGAEGGARTPDVRTPDVVVWNPWSAKAERMGDFGDTEYKHMCCVEPGVVTGLQTVPAGAVWRVGQAITVRRGGAAAGAGEEGKEGKL